jgi:hypothetical protein
MRVKTAKFVRVVGYYGSVLNEGKEQERKERLSYALN